MLPKLMDLKPPAIERYVEPFCGSACYFLTLKPKQAILSDINSDLIATYRAIKGSPENVADAIKRWRPTRRAYYTVRASQPTRQIDAAARFVYLNRLAFNGVYRENQFGQFNVPFGGQRNGHMPTRSELLEFSRALRNTKLCCSDFEDIVDATVEGDFLYLDPPYHYGAARNRGEYGRGAFTSVDLARFVAAAARASERGVHVLISYNRAHQLLKVLRGWSLSYCVARRSVAGFSSSRLWIREYLIRNY
jgi:DNA adenine methylase